MAISIEPFERQFRGLGDAITRGGQPPITGEDGLHALAIVEAIYTSCRTSQKVKVTE
jgi:predicted dehydrogenase